MIFKLDKRNVYSLAHVLGAVERDAPDLVGSVEVTRNPDPEPGDVVVYSFNTFMAPEVFEEIRRLPEDTIKVAGGPHPTAKPEQCIEEGFDVVFVGEGEKVVPDALRDLIRRGDTEERPGVYKGEGRPEPAPRVEKLEEYPPYSETFRVFAPIEITRGCPWGCAFCQVTYMFGARPRHRPVEDIVKWVRRGVELRDHRFARFVAPDALAYGSPDGVEIREDKVERLLKALRSVEGLEKVFFGSFPAELRPDSVARSEEGIEIIAALADNERVNMGAQSGSDRILRAVRRGHTVEDVVEAVESCLDVGLTPVVDFIFGLPGERYEDQIASVELAEWIMRKGGEVRLHYFMPLPGTPLEGKDPTPIHPEVRRKLGEWTRKGKAEGSWGHQERLSRIAASLARSGCSSSRPRTCGGA